MSITLELSEKKWRPERDLPKLWDENKDALVALALTAALGGKWQGRGCQSKLAPPKDGISC
jgi:hypothetical protein